MAYWVAIAVPAETAIAAITTPPLGLIKGAYAQGEMDLIKDQKLVIIVGQRAPPPW